MSLNRMMIRCFNHKISMAIALVLVLVLNVQAQFVQEQKLTASDGIFLDRFGRSVSLNGNHLVVGASGNDDGTDSGSAYVFEFQVDGSWQEVVKLTASDAAEGDEFGNSVSLSNDRLVVGAPEDDDNGAGSGSAYVFERQVDGSWQEVAKLTASDAAEGDEFGGNVSLSDDRLVVGARGDDDNGAGSGSAYVFERQVDGSWQEVAKLTASDGTVDDEFGASVSLSGDRLGVGAPTDDDGGVSSGSAYMFERQADGSWQEVAKLTASDAASGDMFGRSVSLSGNRFVAGALSDDDAGRSSGSAYVFERQGDGSWQEVAKLTASDAATFEAFGRSVSISGDRLVAGTSGSAAFDMPGSAYVFERQGDGSWQEVTKLTAADAAPGDGFGLVSLSGDHLVIGAPGDDDNGSNSGSAYVFGLSASPPSSCDCNQATIVGTNGNDKLVGTPGDDVICGLGGDDRLFGEGGNDCIDGGSGNDRIFGGSGHDLLLGRSGNDSLRGEAGVDDLRGGSGDDNLRGGSGDDRLQGDGGNDLLRGNDGNDVLRGGTGEDIVDGDSGDDDLRGGSDNDIVKGDSGNDVIEGNGGNDILRGGAGDDDLRGGAGDDELSGGNDNDVVRGDGGSDSLRGGSGDDELNGGSHDDLLRGDRGNDTLRGGAGTDQCIGGSGVDTSADCEETASVP